EVTASRPECSDQAHTRSAAWEGPFGPALVSAGHGRPTPQAPPDKAAPVRAPSRCPFVATLTPGNPVARSPRRRLIEVTWPVRTHGQVGGVEEDVRPATCRTVAAHADASPIAQTA